MRENRPSGLMRGGKQTVIGLTSQSVASRLLYTKAILDGAQQIAVPAFVATLSICIVFVSVVFLNGPARFLFVPLALAVVFAMMMSYFLSRTLVPVMMRFLLGSEVQLYKDEAAEEQGRQGGGHPPDKQGNGSGSPSSAGGRNDGQTKASPPPRGGEGPHKDWIWRIHERFNHHFEDFRQRYRGMLEWSLDNRWLTIFFFLALFAISACVIPFVGEDFFPAVDAGQFRLHVRTVAGTRIEQADVVFTQVEQYIRSVVPKDELRLMIDNIGLPVGGVNLAFSDSATIGSTDGEILAALNPNHKTSVWTFVRRLRRELPVRFPGVTFYFQPADIVSQILNFGLPAPVDIQVVGRSPDNHKVAEQIVDRVSKIPGAVDVTLHQLVDAPQFDVNVDRQRAIDLGLTENDVANSVLISLSSSGQTARNYWVNPVNGVNYLVAVQTPQYQVDSLNRLNNTPIIVPGRAQPQLLSNLSTFKRDTSPLVINHYNVQPTFDIYADAEDRDLGGVAQDINKVVDEFQPKPAWYQTAIKSLPFCHDLFKLPPSKLPKATTIAVRGQVQSMNSAFSRLGLGIVFAVMLVYFLMVVNFQSWLDPLIIIMALPGAFSGILWMLFSTHTTFSVPSLMGTIMCIGVATSNSILLITFANDERLLQRNAYDSALDAGTTRLRPVLMTALAMILGMIPMSLGLGEGGEQNAPLGRAVIGGLLFATATTLFFVPVVYSMLRKKDLVPVSEDDAELLFAEDEPERQLATAAAHRDGQPDRPGENRNQGAPKDPDKSQNGAGGDGASQGAA